MVEQIEEFSSELNTHSFADVRSLEHSEIKVVDSGSAKYGIDPRFGARSPIWRSREATGVKPLAEVAAACFLVASGNNVGPNVSDSKVCGFQRGRARSR